LEVVEDHGSLAYGEDAELGERRSAERNAVTAAEEALVADAPQVAVYPKTAVVASGEPRGAEGLVECGV
jgi:hypothetical protein